MKEHQVPQTLDAPPLALIFDASQFYYFCGFAMIGLLIDKILIMSIIGIIVGNVVSRYSESMPAGYIRHILYYFGFPTLKGRRIPNGLDREFRP